MKHLHWIYSDENTGIKSYQLSNDEIIKKEKKIKKKKKISLNKSFFQKYIKQELPKKK